MTTPGFRDRVREALGGLYRLEEAASEEEFREKWRAFGFDLLLLDMRLRVDREGLDVLRGVYREDPLQPVIMVSAYGDTESAIEAVGAGAMMFLHKEEFTPALLARMVESVLERGRLRRQVALLRSREQARDTEALLGLSEGMRQANAEIRRAADSTRPMAICGERGTGTSLAARLIHRYSGRAENGFLEVGAEELHEGNERIWARVKGGTLAVRLGAGGSGEGREWTGGEALARASFENHTGVVFLLQEGLNTWQEGWFGEVTGFGQGVEEIRLPPLRERAGDVAVLAGHFLQRQALAGQTEVRSLGGEALAALERWHWPGNVRELRLAVEYAALRASAEGVDTVEAGHLPLPLGGGEVMSMAGDHCDYREATARAEVELVDRVRRERGIGQKTKLAEALGYNDRFVLGRRLAKALLDHRELAGKHPDLVQLFASEMKTERAARAKKTGKAKRRVGRVKGGGSKNSRRKELAAG